MPLPSRHGLYEPTLEHDACGLGFVAPLPFSISAAAVGLWVVLSLVLSWIAGRIPAATAAHAPVAESLRAL